MIELWKKSLLCFSNGCALLYLANLAALMEMMEMLEASKELNERSEPPRQLYLLKNPKEKV
jgi:hypothetical protein